ncbi:MAG TPA: flagellar basal body rod protein FlgB [Methylomirabilota bacterium]|nr:flagellar basal body rod protein FlgB [Methylomirabilota bacterium]
MIDALFSQTGYQMAKKLLDATALRHEAIASNLANVETPHYRRLDLSPTFAAELQQALETGDPGRIARLKPTLATDTRAVSNRRDGNTVQLESELLRLNQNALEHALETQLLTGALLRLRLAISGRPG